MLTSTNNTRVKQIAEYSKKSKARRKDGVFLIEGIRMLREVPLEAMREVYVTGHFLENLSPEDKTLIRNIQQDDGVSFEEVSDDVMRKMADTQTPQGVLAVVKEKRWELKDLLGETPLLLILENIQDPGNLGNMFRTGEGAGVTGIIMSSDMADVYNPKVVRSTMGAILRVPFIYVDSIPDTVKELREKYNVTSYAAHLKGTKNYDEISYKGASAFLIGNEGNGLTKEAADAASEYVLIPMLGRVESMNAATSAAILTFEAARQRRQ
ncbi:MULTISPECIES: TrmH family RNA methyltransferase [unclassified Butyrivibrio]|uniref:TrmH family RNA methyltransferase n=1 Tax=unclassified Butyrivibrio TaxID=2639466 RepID=UPI000425ED0F|nr:MULTISPECIES: RNA methyltransferase [unclassified Butyrivibrio]SEK95003.1 RNA methyltransferase, TrmH family [Butyrivibrio sp. ob235]